MGSLHDYTHLTEALERHDSAERLAEFLKTREGYENANRAYDRLCASAIACGFSFKSDETALQFARRRVATFTKTFGGA